MSTPIVPLFTRSLKGWLSAKGFWVVLAAMLLPLVITGAWAATHRADVAVTGMTWSPTDLTEGTNVTITATIKNLGSVDANGFNATLVVGTLSGGQLIASPANSNVTRIDHLGPGESRELTLSWNATPGVLTFFAEADSRDPSTQADAIAESEEQNNFNATQVVVREAAPNSEKAPLAPEGLGGDAANATTVSDLVVSDLIVPQSGDVRNVTVRVQNLGPNDVTGANVTLRVGQDFGDRNFFWPNTTTVPLDLAANETKDVSLEWFPAETGGVYWAEAFAQAPPGSSDPSAGDNDASRAVVVEPKVSSNPLTPTESQRTAEQLTIKQFYTGFLVFAFLSVLVPLVALFYAGGIVSEEQDKKTLGYILTRPTPRWAFPLVKFVASFLVAGAAIAIGVVGTYVLLFGTVPSGSGAGYLVTPLLLSLLALLVYGAFFAFLGVWVKRPYLVGLAIVLGWENAAALFLPWVSNFTIGHHLLGTFVSRDLNTGAATGVNWPLDQGLQWFPITPDGQHELWIVLAIAAASLVAAAYTMKQREFEL